jgi:heme iron utilization protein
MQPAANDTQERQPLVARLAANSEGLLEHIARDYGVSTLEVVRNLPAEQGVIAPAEAFADIMQDITQWGEILFLIHNADIVLECTGTLPPGSFGHGYFNIHGDSPIGGHIRAENCKAIAFVSRARRTPSSSSMLPAMRSSRYSCAATPLALCFPSRSQNSRRYAAATAEAD